MAKCSECSKVVEEEIVEDYLKSLSIKSKYGMKSVYEKRVRRYEGKSLFGLSIKESMMVLVLSGSFIVGRSKMLEAMMLRGL